VFTLVLAAIGLAFAIRYNTFTIILMLRIRPLILAAGVTVVWDTASIAATVVKLARR
jgi:hypothetical protein